MTQTPPASEPLQLSVLMVTHGSWPLTERALAALAEHTEIPFEVIVVDNDSPDQTPRQLAERADLRVIYNDENRGFGPATNQAAAQARGAHLLLLNTDAFVRPGWWEPMLAALGRPGVGAVVPRLLHEDGSLQDGGALLARDGTVFMYGDGDDPGALRYRFRRVVQYGAAACLLIRRTTFMQLGGFDDVFAPAYYEDADLGLRLAQQDLAVIYEPRATAIHVRYGSGSSQSASALSERHRGRFATRWQAQLAAHPWTFRGASEQATIAARDASATPRILVCAAADEPGAGSLVEVLVESWPIGRVTWATDVSPPDPWLQLGVEVIDRADWRWLDSRLFHYDATVLGGDVDEQLSAALHRTQPQVAQISMAEIPGSPHFRPADLYPVLAAAGIAPADATR
jgi:GT2 family glycosyltransferase